MQSATYQAIFIDSRNRANKDYLITVQVFCQTIAGIPSIPAPLKGLAVNRASRTSFSVIFLCKVDVNQLDQVFRVPCIPTKGEKMCVAVPLRCLCLFAPIPFPIFKGWG